MSVGGRRRVTVIVDGVPLEVPEGDTVAAVLLNRGGPRAWEVRRAVGGGPRGPLCGMGICFECRATVDGRPQERTCMIVVREGMEVRTDD